MALCVNTLLDQRPRDLISTGMMLQFFMVFSCHTIICPWHYIHWLFTRLYAYV